MKQQLKWTPIGVSLLALLGMSSPVMAQDKSPIDLQLGGYFIQSVNLVDVDKEGTSSFEDEVLAQNGEIYFKAKTTLPEGTEIGVRIELEAEGASDDLLDEHYLYIKADWGKVILGAENGVGHLMHVRAPRFVPGLKMFDNSITETIIEEAYDLQFDAVNVIQDAHMSTKLEHISGDVIKFSYLSPKVGGLQLAASFTPNNRDRNGGENNVANSERSQGDAIQEDIIELAMRYTGSYQGVGYRLSYSDVSSDTLNSAIDPQSTSTGLQVTWGDWVFGANLSKYDNLGELPGYQYVNSESIETLNYALKYKRGDSYWGLGFAESDESETNVAGNVTEYEEIMIGGGRKIAAGVEFGYYYQITEVDRPLAGDGEETSAETASLGLTLALTF
jgi:hypothetical protein